MRHYLTLSIPSPCHEKWENFQRIEKGGFCASCNKDVIDFTSWTETEIKSYFRTSSGYACGRFRTGQLKTYRLNDNANQKATLLPLSFLGMTLLLTPGQADAAEFNRPRKEITEFKSHNAESIIVVAGLTQITITGVVMDGIDNIPMPGVNVILKNTVNGTTTDVNGRFTITITNPEKR